jgi:hypothetical protein
MELKIIFGVDKNTFNRTNCGIETKLKNKINNNNNNNKNKTKCI